MRHRSRELALQVLFQNEFAPAITATQLVRITEENLDRDTVEYAEELIKGVDAHHEAIDAKIGAASRHWKIERMAAVDRNVLRIATFEMKFAPHPLTENIVINEAVEIAKKFGTTESGSFVNGVLDQIAKAV